MKSLLSLFLVTLLICCNGCFTSAVNNLAEGQGHEGLIGGITREGPPQPAYYGLMVLSVPADIGTFPIQGLVYLTLGALWAGLGVGGHGSRPAISGP